MATNPTNKAPSHTPRRRSRKSTSASTPTPVTVEGASPLVNALDAQVRFQVTGAMLIVAAIAVTLLVITAVASVNFLYAVALIGLAFAAGWLTARSLST